MSRRPNRAPAAATTSLICASSVTSRAPGHRTLTDRVGDYCRVFQTPIGDCDKCPVLGENPDSGSPHGRLR
ncbi:Uncharacterised protein [Mycobacteroides abscessus subsp. abscessus]|nr:Uncharacterised protein [Mycobacteroides abscessus subsp. abscessus]